MPTYQVNEGSQNPIVAPSITRFNDDGSVTTIPIDPTNSDYQAYLNLVEDETAPK